MLSAEYYAIGLGFLSFAVGGMSVYHSNEPKCDLRRTVLWLGPNFWPERNFSMRTTKFFVVGMSYLLLPWLLLLLFRWPLKAAINHVL